MVEVRRTRDVVDDDGDAGISDVARDQAAEALLAGRVPELQSDCPVLEICAVRGGARGGDAHIVLLRKSMPIVAWYAESNVPYLRAGSARSSAVFMHSPAERWLTHMN